MKCFLIICVLFLRWKADYGSLANILGQNKFTKTYQLNSSASEYSFHSAKKVYLKEILENFENDYEDQANKIETSMKDNYERDVCRLRILEISINVEDCGRITLNTTKCDGYCKSMAMIVPNTKIQKNFCYACKSHEFEYATYQIKCLDGQIKILNLKTVKACTCFKHSEKMSSIANVKEKSFLN